MKTPNTLCQLIPDFANRPGLAIKYKKNGQWIDVNWSEYQADIYQVSSGLKTQGVKKGTRVALMSNTRYEWVVFDWAVMGMGAELVPIYQTVTSEDLEHILNDSCSEYIVVENKAMLRLVRSVAEHCPQLKMIFSIDSIEPEVANFEDLKKTARKEDQAEFNASCRSLQPGDTATILYTSGTTGKPKGVVLTHDSALLEVAEAFPYCGARTDDVSLSFLPYAHILGRIEHWGHTFIGYQMAFAESLEKLRLNLPEIRPTFMVAVPRVFEKVYASVQANLDSQPVSKLLAQKALTIGKAVSELRLQGRAVPLSLALQYEVARKLVLSKIKAAFGGRIRFAISGGAPMSREIAMFFHACDVLILEGYGLTETTAAITVNTPFDYKFGSVGKPIGEVKIKIAEDGEVMIKSRKVMKEYWNDPEGTKAAFTDGWFHTGDIGELLPSGDLRITDRKKDLIKTAGGKYVAPQKLENLLKLHPVISQALIHGDQKKYIVTLLTLDKNFVLNYAKEKEISYSDYADLTQKPQIQDLARKAVAEANQSLASYETIKRFAVLPKEFTVEEGEVTPSLKLKRKILDQKYSAEITALYS